MDCVVKNRSQNSSLGGSRHRSQQLMQRLYEHGILPLYTPHKVMFGGFRGKTSRRR